MKNFQPFVMERLMSKHENEVDYNLSESGVHPLTLGELIELQDGSLDRILQTEINYPHANGIPSLREHIAGLYPGATADNVLVTTGAIEANYNAIRTLVDPGQEIVVELPNYLQIWGLAQNHGVSLKTFNLLEEQRWKPDLEKLRSVVSERTRLIAVCNPNNPTGAILSDKEMDAIIAIADRVGCWILADEVYRGAERTTDQETPSFYGRYDKVLATGSMSKAYGLPGLRLGWAVGPVPDIDDIWARHEYTTISAAMLSNHLASLALSPAVRPSILKRTRSYIREGYENLEGWLRRHPDTFSLTPPQAAAIAFVRYKLDINSTDFVERLMKEKSVLIAPGDHFGMDRCLRVSFGLPRDYMNEALSRIGELVEELSPRPSGVG